MIEEFVPRRHDTDQVKRILACALSPTEELEAVFSSYQHRPWSLFVTSHEGKITGCIGFSRATGEIRHIAVDPEHRGRHCARHMIEHLTTYVRSPLLKVMSDAACAPFFEACGFICDKEGDRYRCYRVNVRKRCC